MRSYSFPFGPVHAVPHDPRVTILHSINFGRLNTARFYYLELPSPLTLRHCLRIGLAWNSFFLSILGTGFTVSVLWATFA